ncbi:uncharacterized protein EDB93DRAFT_68431 [Suillus bovinus]|uniref:uncharacterized protein n=1 Tax=Suillus bovinus TaxID=48563 RepID=UPI001B87F3C7|nr:uncharacterized protein EDB93DRAFT_68431 [Suillus bovinus]KAG2130842.1 hypothetical protein EDB93DRAFT_68431 [Suillus bovinus]
MRSSSTRNHNQMLLGSSLLGMNACDSLNLDGSPKPSTKDRGTYGHAQKMRASMTYAFGKLHGLGNMHWHESDAGDGTMVGNPSISVEVSSFMCSLRRRKIQASEVANSARAITSEICLNFTITTTFLGTGLSRHINLTTGAVDVSEDFCRLHIRWCSCACCDLMRFSKYRFMIFMWSKIGLCYTFPSGRPTKMEISSPFTSGSSRRTKLISVLHVHLLPGCESLS